VTKNASGSRCAYLSLIASGSIRVFLGSQGFLGSRFTTPPMRHMYLRKPEPFCSRCFGFILHHSGLAFNGTYK